MSLGNNIKMFRIKMQMSQEKVAEELGVSRQAVSKWETELSYPDTENLIALAKLLHVSADELTNELTKEDIPKVKSKSSFTNGKILILSVLGIFIIVGSIYIIKHNGNVKTLENNLERLDAKIVTLQNPKVIESDTSTDMDEEKEVKQDYLNSPESLEVQMVAQAFAKAYFSGDLEEVKLYVSDVGSAEIYEKNIYDNLEYLTLKWNPEDLSTKTTISLQYQFQENGTDSANYLGMEMMKVSDKWKVTGFYLEK